MNILFKFFAIIFMIIEKHLLLLIGRFSLGYILSGWPEGYILSLWPEGLFEGYLLSGWPLWLFERFLLPSLSLPLKISAKP